MASNNSNRNPAPSIVGDPLGAIVEGVSTVSVIPQLQQAVPTSPRIMTVKYSLDGKLSTLNAPSAIIPWSNDYNTTLTASKKALRRHLPSRSGAGDYWLAISVGNGQALLAEISPEAFADTLQELDGDVFLCGGALVNISRPLDICVMPIKDKTETENYYYFELMAIGDPYVGKSQFLKYFVTGKTDAPAVTLLHDHWNVQRLRLKASNEAIKTSLWDTAGQEKHKALPPQILRRISGVFLMYDITEEATFNNCKKWLVEARQHIQPGAQIILVGNQLDREASRKVKYSTAQQFASQHGWPFIETSSIVGTNVETAFQLLVQEMLTQFKRDSTLEKYFKSSKNVKEPRIDLSDESQNGWAWYKPWTWDWAQSLNWFSRQYWSSP